MGSAELHLSDSFDELGTYFGGDVVVAANELVSDKVDLAWKIFNTTQQTSSVVVAADGSSITLTWEPNYLEAWKGGAQLVINGSSLSTDEADADFVIDGVDVVMTSSEAPTDWANPLAAVSLGFHLEVAGGVVNTNTLGINGLSVEAGDMRAAFTGSVSINESSQTIEMSSGRFEIQYDTDPSEQVVLSTIYLEGGFSLNGATQQASGTISEFGFVNEAGHYFYGTGLDVTLAELEALPPGSTTTELLQAVFQSDADTVYTATDLTIPEGFERVVIEGARDVPIVANSLDNLITGNAGDNKVDGGAGFDTFVTQGSVYGATGTLNIDGSVTITTAEGGSDTLTNVELVQVAGDSASSAAPSDYVSAAERTYTADPSQVFSQVLPEISTGDGSISLLHGNTSFQKSASVVLPNGSILTGMHAYDPFGGWSLQLALQNSDGSVDIDFGLDKSVSVGGAASVNEQTFETSYYSYFDVAGGLIRYTIGGSSGNNGMSQIVAVSAAEGQLLSVAVDKNSLSNVSGFYGLTGATNVNGQTLLAWTVSASDGNRSAIWGMVREPNGVLSEPFVIAPMSGWDVGSSLYSVTWQNDAKVLAMPDGSFAISWKGYASGSDIYARFVAADGTPLTDPIAVETGGLTGRSFSQPTFGDVVATATGDSALKLFYKDDLGQTLQRSLTLEQSGSWTIEGSGRGDIAGFAMSAHLGPDEQVCVVYKDSYGKVGSLWFDKSGTFTGEIDLEPSPVERLDGVCLLSDGGFYVIGRGPGYTTSGMSSNQDLVISKYDPQGKLDYTYGNDASQWWSDSSTPRATGTSFINMSGLSQDSYDEVLGVTAATSGALYILSRHGDVASLGSPRNISLVRVSSDGILDSDFGGTGIVKVEDVSVNGSWAEAPLGISTDSSGNVLVAYYTSTYSGPGTSAQIEVARFLPDGSYDSSFGGGDGRAVIDMSGDSSWTQDGAQLLTVDSQDRPVLAFQRFWGTEVVRLNTDGSIDKIFTEPTNQLGTPSDSGVDPIFDLAPGSYDRPAWVQLDPDDNILVGVVDGMSIDGVWQQTYTITKFLESGGLDLSFDEVPPPTYSLTSYDGSELPTWLSFDAQTRTISGTPGVLDGGQDFYVLTATDYLGNTTSEFFSIDVTQLNPEFVFSASIDSVTGLITVDSGWTGPLEGLQYVVQGAGVTYLDSAIDNDFGLSGISSNGTAGMASVSVGGTGAEAVSGDGSFARIMLKAQDGVLDVVVSATNILFDEVGDAVDTPVTPPASISFAVGASVGVVGTPSLDVTEGSGAAEAQKVSIDLALDRAIMTNQFVSWSIVPNGEAGVDATDFVGGVLPSGVVNFVAGQTTGKIEFEIAADTTVERAEGYKVVLAPSGGLVVSGSSELIGEIANDDKATVSITGNSVLLPEGNSGVTSYSFTVELDQPAFGNQTVDWMVDFVPGEASATDFSGLLSGSLSFAEGETSKMITIGVQGDTLKEGREDFKIKLANTSSDLMISDTDGVIDVQIKDDDGYDLNGQVYFWKDQTVTQADQVTRTGKWLMDDVDVSVVGVDPSLTLAQLKAMPIKMGTVELNTDSGRGQADLWVQHTDVTSFQFEVAKGAYNANFTSSLTTGWTVSVEDKGQTVLIGGIYNGATGTQTLDRIKIGVVSFDTPAEGQSIQMGLMSSQASNDAQQTNATGPVAADLTFVTTTDGSAMAVFAGGFKSTGLTEGLYLVDADKDFMGVSFTQAEIKSVTTADAREALLMALGRDPTISDHQYIAADIDGDGRVTTNDARTILGAALGKPTQMETVQWRFVDEDADLTGLDMNHVKQGVDWQQGVDLLLNDDATHNMIAILLGDVNGSYRPEDYLTHQMV